MHTRPGIGFLFLVAVLGTVAGCATTSGSDEALVDTPGFAASSGDDTAWQQAQADEDQARRNQQNADQQAADQAAQMAGMEAAQAGMQQAIDASAAAVAAIPYRDP